MTEHVLIAAVITFGAVIATALIVSGVTIYNLRDYLWRDKE